MEVLEFLEAVEVLVQQQLRQEQYTEAMEALEKRLDALLTSELGKDVKTNPETITALRNSFMETNKVEIVDPIDLKKLTKVLLASSK